MTKMKSVLILLLLPIAAFGYRLDPSRAYIEFELRKTSGTPTVYTPQWGCWAPTGGFTEMQPRPFCVGWAPEFVYTSWGYSLELRCPLMNTKFVGPFILKTDTEEHKLNPGEMLPSGHDYKIKSLVIPDFEHRLWRPNQAIATCELWSLGSGTRIMTLNIKQPTYSETNQFGIVVTPNVINLTSNNRQWEAETTVYAEHYVRSRLTLESSTPIEVNTGEGWSQTGSFHSTDLWPNDGRSKTSLHVRGVGEGGQVVTYTIRLTLEPVG